MGSHTGAGRPLDRPGLQLALPALLVGLVILADTLEGPGTAFVGMLVAAPMLSAVFGTPLTVLLVGLLTVVSAALLGLQAGDGLSGAQLLHLGVILGFTAVAAAVAAARLRGEARLAQADRVVAAVTEAIIRPLPPAVDGVLLASRYLGADADAHVGGDFYEVVATDHGVRVVVGDVRGKGLSAVRMANYVLGAFRSAARREADLAAVAGELDAVVQTEGGAEDFVTALLLEVRDGAVTALCCGHPQPQVAGAVGFTEARLPVDVPLGLGAGRVAPRRLPPTARRLLLHSDGFTEARSPDGRFIDLPATLAPLAQTARDGEQLLDAVVEAIRVHVGGPLRDDIALLWLDASAVVTAAGVIGQAPPPVGQVPAARPSHDVTAASPPRSPAGR